jgi:hypothetical protein
MELIQIGAEIIDSSIKSIVRWDRVYSNPHIRHA